MMQKFRATVRLTEIEGADPAHVQRALDERMKEAGFAKWRVLSIEAEGAATRSRHRDIHVPRHRAQSEGWGLFLVAAGAWVVWLFWLLAAG
jgi:hypothetical protein